MKANRNDVRLAGVVVGFLIWGTPVFAFMGDYISADRGDKAVIVTVKSSDIGYESDDIPAGDIDRKLFSIGLSRSVGPPAKVFGSLNYTFDGEFGGGGGNDLDAGYSLSAGGIYNFWDRETYSLQTYGQVNYIFDETFEYSAPDMGNMKLNLDGYEFLFGVMGTLKFHSRFHGYGALQLVPFSAFTMERKSSAVRDSLDFEREVMFGLNVGLIYDFFRWFVKAEAEIGSEMALGLATGMKF